MQRAPAARGKTAARDLGIASTMPAATPSSSASWTKHRKTPISSSPTSGSSTIARSSAMASSHHRASVDALSLRRRRPRPRRDRRHGGALSVQVRQDGHDPALVPALPRRRGADGHGHGHVPDGHGGGAAVGVDPDPRHRPELPGGPVPRRLQCGDARRVPVHRAPGPRPPRAGEQGRHRADQPRPHGNGRLHRSHQGARRRR